jgi:flagellar biosynthesis protein FlhG
MHRIDQAAGLRKLLGPRRLRIAPIIAASSGVGKTMFVINFAAAVRRHGLNVLILDQTHGEISGALGFRQRYELMHVLEGHYSLASIAVRGPDSLWVIPASRGVDALARSNLNAAGLCQLLTPTVGELDLILVNSRPNRAQAACDLAIRADSGREVIQIISTKSDLITASYSHMKQLARKSEQLEFRLLINRAVTEETARRVFRNVAKTAKDNVDARVHYGGCIGEDPALRFARFAHQTIFTNTPGGCSAQAFDRLAARSSAWAVPEFYRTSQSIAHH